MAASCNITNIFLVSRILLSFHSFNGTWNKLKNIRTRHRALTGTYLTLFSADTNKSCNIKILNIKSWISKCQDFTDAHFGHLQHLLLHFQFFRNLNFLSLGKVFKYEVISGPHFSVFGLNTEIYSVNLYSVRI